MSTPVWIQHPFISSVSGSLIMLPTPASLSLWWNFGSILGLCLVGQMVTGIVLAMQYVSEATSAFESVVVIWTDVHYGWWLRSLHMNGASMFFMAAYLHVGRGLYYRSYQNGPLWVSGVVILLTLMAVAFLGYVLPWGQMSFWGATVITNLISAIPYFGESMVYWIWGGYSVSAPTLTRFFAIHFLAPFGLAGLVVGHLILLHEGGSLNPVGVVSDLDKLPFHPYYSSKDLVGFIVGLMSLALVSTASPWWLGDAENFIPADPMVTPIHIKPEWYFLFAYAILRSIPSKLGGVLALGLSILILLVLPVLIKGGVVTTSFLQKSMFWLQVSCFMLLTWVGGNVVEEPFVTIGQVASSWYFVWFLVYVKLI